MVDHWRWHEHARTWRWTRAVATAALLLTCALLAGFAPSAMASSPEMRGEWEIVLKAGVTTNKGTTVIRQEAGAKGEFSSEPVKFELGGPGTFTGTLEGSNAKVKVTTTPAGPIPASEFESETMTVTSGPGTLEISGEGTFKAAGTEMKGTTVAKRIKTYTEVEEREVREKKEEEEKRAREAIRGEWELTANYGQSIKGIAIITEAATPQNKFASTSALFESVIPGTFSGTLEGKEASVTVTTEAAGPYPATTFNGTKLSVALTSKSMSITGTGTIEIDKNSIPATATATRIKTYQEVVERETAAREAKEQQEEEALLAKEKAEREAKEKGERETAEKREREAREAVEKATKIPPTTVVPPATVTPLVSALLATKTLTVGKSGAISLKLTNPNSSSVNGQAKLTYTTPTKTGKGSSAKHTASSKTSTLGDASFSISSKGSELIKVKLSHAGLAELTRRKTLQVVVTITTQASGQASTSKTFSLTLHAAKAASRKH